MLQTEEPKKCGGTRIITPEEFKFHFEASVKPFAKQLIATKMVWPHFTYVFFRKGGILEKVATNLGLKPHPEYFKFDMVMYQEKDTQHFIESQTWAKVLSVVVEHENNWGDSVQEMNKLTTVNSPLRVLITYPELDEDEARIKSNYEEILRYSDWANDFSTSRRILVIFGGIGDKIEDVKWEYFTYKEGNLIEIL